MAIFNVFSESGLRKEIVETEFPSVEEMQSICLIGSMRFYDLILHEATKIHKLGHIAYIPYKDDEENIPKERLKSYDTLIREMIKLSDIVYVINKDRYIGKSVESEIMYAKEHNKRVVYYESIKETKIITLIGSFRFKRQFELIKMMLDASLNKNYKYRFLTFLPEFIDIDNFPRYLTENKLKIVHEIFGKKIQNSDLVIVIDVDGYDYKVEDKHVGEDTKREIIYAEAFHIHLTYLSKIYQNIKQRLDHPSLYYPEDSVLSEIINEIDHMDIEEDKNETN